MSNLWGNSLFVMSQNRKAGSQEPAIYDMINYTEFNEAYQLVLLLSLEGLVPDDDSVRLLSHELEELD